MLCFIEMMIIFWNCDGHNAIADVYWMRGVNGQTTCTVRRTNLLYVIQNDLSSAIHWSEIENTKFYA